MNPVPQPLPKIKKEEKLSGLKTTSIIAGTFIILSGAGVHFYDKGTHLTQQETRPFVQPKTISMGKSVLVLTLLAPDKANEALNHSGFSSDEQTRILTGFKQQKLKLVTMPVFDAAGTGSTIIVASGGFSQTVHLMPKPTTLVFPVSGAVQVSFTPASISPPKEIYIGIASLYGTVRLPALHQDQELVMPVNFE